MNKAELLEAIQNVLPGVDEQELIDATANIVFDKDHIFTYHDEISVTYPFKSGVAGAIRASHLYKVTQNMEDDWDVSITIHRKEGKKKKGGEEDSNEMIVQSKEGKFKSGFPMPAEIPFESPTKEDEPKWVKVPRDFIAGLDLCSFSVSKDISTGVLTCIQVKGDTILSGDNLRFTKYEMSGKIKGPLFFVPGTSARHLAKHRITHVAQAGSWLHFRSASGVIFSCRPIMGDETEDLPEIFGVKGKKIKLPDVLKKAIQRVGVPVLDNRESEVGIILDKGKLTCLSDGKAGWAEETIKIKYDGPKIELGVDPKFLSEILGKTQGAVIGKDRILFEGEKFQHVMARIR